MARVVVSSTADADTAGILAYLAAQAGRQTAINYNALFETLYDRLAGYPASGPIRPALGSNTRICIVSPYIVIYHHIRNDDTVTVLRIVHSRRKISGKLLAESP